MDEHPMDFEKVVKSAESSIRASLSAVPAPLKAFLEPLIRRNLRVLAREPRVPRIALYGRAGAGKSSLINAIMDAPLAAVGVGKPVTSHPESYVYERQGWKLRFIDSRGVGDQPGREAYEQAIDYVVKQRVDVLLFVIPADERGYVAEDVEFLSALKSAHERRQNAELPIVLVLNKIDRIDPVDEWNPPYRLSLMSQVAAGQIETPRQQKEANITECLRARVDDYKVLTSKYVPVSVGWTKFSDRRYNIDHLVMTIYL